MQITADELKTQGLIDTVIDEPINGAHRDKQGAAQLVGDYIVSELNELEKYSIDEVISQRMERILNKGSFTS